MLRIYRLFFYFSTLYLQHACIGSPLSGSNVRSAEKKEFPFVVSLSWKYPIRISHPERYHFCGGALISKKHVLTTAHCMYKVKSHCDMFVKINDGDLLKSTNYKVKKWISYDEWAKINVTNTAMGILNDIAIIELARKISSKIKPAILSDIPEAKLSGSKVVTAGWGDTFADPRFQSKPRYLQTSELYVLNPDECLRNLEDDVKDQINSSPHIFICTSIFPPAHIECGDSGSPLFIEPNQLVGVNKGYCIETLDDMILSKQNLHVSIDYYREFITDVIESKSKNCTIFG